MGVLDYGVLCPICELGGSLWIGKDGKILDMGGQCLGFDLAWVYLTMAGRLDGGPYHLCWGALLVVRSCSGMESRMLSPKKVIDTFAYDGGGQLDSGHVFYFVGGYFVSTTLANLVDVCWA